MESGQENTEKKKQLVRRYIQFLKPYRYVIALVVVLGILQFAAPLAVPWMTKIMIDEVLQHKEGFWTLGRVVTFLGLVYVFSVIVNFIRNHVTARLGNRMAMDVRRQLYEHIQTLSQRFYDNRQVGSILSRVINDVNGAQNLVGGGVINLIMDLFLVVFAGVMLFQFDWVLALLALWLLPLYYLTFANLNIRIRFAWRAVHRQMERISGVLVERISGMKIVQSFGREKTELERFDKQARNHYEYTMSALFLSNLLGQISQTFNHAGGLIIWFVGGAYVLSGKMTTGELIAFQAYLSQMYNPIQRFSAVNVTIQNSLTNIERIFEVFDIESEIKNKEGSIALRECKGDIVFEDVSFTYIIERPEDRKQHKNGDPDLAVKFKPAKRFYIIPPKTKSDPPPYTMETREALRHIDLHAAPGQVIALVGQSGAGKSTLVHFIPRFYDPDEGRILLDGVDLREYNLGDLRKQISIVMQDNILFSGTVYENIAYGDPSATREQVIDAAKAANAHEFVMEWEHRYDTILGERGVRLSGGQKQRIAIARALLKNPRILILDEATSALDAESEALVTEALERLMENRTTFIIAHRLATVVRADQIVVIDRGKIVERGTHQDLLGRNGAYRKLYETQYKAMRPEELELQLRASE